MRKVRDLVPNLSKKDGKFGIEIEMEGNRLPGGDDLHGTNWRYERDGSLRGRQTGEYVLREPVDFDKISKDLDVLRDTMVNKNTVFEVGVTAGVHVHMNMQKENLIDLYKFLTLYYIFENTIVDFCADWRKGNHFCLRACDAENVIDYVVSSVIHGSFVFDDNIRYSALNLTSLLKYGSVEFRALQSDDNFDNIIVIAGTLEKILESSKEFETPIDIISAFSSSGEVFGIEMLGEWAKYYDVKNTENMKIGMRLAQDLAYCTDWKYMLRQEAARPARKKKIIIMDE